MADKWVVAIRYDEPFEMVSRFPAEALGLTVDGKPVETGEPTCFVVANAMKLSDERGRFDNPQRAQEEADELNRAAAQGPLDPEFAERRERLKALAPDFNRYFEGPRGARWPVRPAKYLIHDWGVGWHPEDFYALAEDLAAVEAAIAGDEANVGKVVDLDTGEEIIFEREVVVRFTEA